MSRWRLRVGLALLPALAAAACDEGPRVELGGGGGGVEIRVDVLAPQTPIRGQPVDLQAAVTEDGAPLASTQVIWSVSPSDPGLTFTSSTTTTGIDGTTRTTLNTDPNLTFSSITVTAAAGDAIGDRTIILQ